LFFISDIFHTPKNNSFQRKMAINIEFQQTARPVASLGLPRATRNAVTTAWILACRPMIKAMKETQRQRRFKPFHRKNSIQKIIA
jgi:hypothetical protein